MRAATVVQQLYKSCMTCFKFYCMFYFTCDRSLRSLKMFVSDNVAARTAQRWLHGVNENAFVYDMTLHYTVCAHEVCIESRTRRVQSGAECDKS